MILKSIKKIVSSFDINKLRKCSEEFCQLKLHQHEQFSCIVFVLCENVISINLLYCLRFLLSLCKMVVFALLEILILIIGNFGLIIEDEVKGC